MGEKVKVNILYDGDEEEIYGKIYKCEKCKCEKVLHGFKYCPKCGSKIGEFIGVKDDEEDEEEDDDEVGW